MIPSHAASSRGCENRAKSPISAINPSAVIVAIPRNARQDLHVARPPLAAGDLRQPGVERVELTFDPVDMDQQLLQRLLRERIIEALGRRASDGAASSTRSCPPGRSVRGAAAASAPGYAPPTARRADHRAL